MAITADSIGTAQSSTSSTSLSFSHTCAAGATLFVSVAQRDAGNISAATYNSVAMTKAVTSAEASDFECSVYYLLSPATGANTVAFTTSATSRWIAAVAISFLGVDQATPIDDTDTSGLDTASPLSLSGLASVTDGAVMMDALVNNDNGTTTMTAATNRVERANVQPTNGKFCASTIITEVTAGSETMEWTGVWTVARLCAVAIKPAAAGGGPLIRGGQLAHGALVRGGRVAA